MFPILYEDENLIAIDKPVNISSIPERSQAVESVLSIVSQYCPGKLYVVHRLDKEVSGLLLFAKSAEMHRFMNIQFEQRHVKKTYQGLAWGSFEQDKGTIAHPIRQFGSGRMGIDPEKGKSSVTDYQVTKRFNGFSLLNLRPLTGRRHQLRVHLYSEGHPLVGDMRYGDRKKQQIFPRLMLHASSLTCKYTNNKHHH